MQATLSKTLVAFLMAMAFKTKTLLFRKTEYLKTTTKRALDKDLQLAKVFQDLLINLLAN